MGFFFPRLFFAGAPFFCDLRGRGRAPEIKKNERKKRGPLLPPLFFCSKLRGPPKFRTKKGPLPKNQTKKTQKKPLPKKGAPSCFFHWGGFTSPKKKKRARAFFGPPSEKKNPQKKQNKKKPPRFLFSMVFFFLAPNQKKFGPPLPGGLIFACPPCYSFLKGCVLKQKNPRNKRTVAVMQNKARPPFFL